MEDQMTDQKQNQNKDSSEFDIPHIGLSNQEKLHSILKETVENANEKQKEQKKGVRFSDQEVENNTTQQQAEQINGEKIVSQQNLNEKQQQQEQPSSEEKKEQDLLESQQIQQNQQQQTLSKENSQSNLELSKLQQQQQMLEEVKKVKLKLQFYCKQKGHRKNIISMLCTNQKCLETFLFCKNCVNELGFHNDHLENVKLINDFIEQLIILSDNQNLKINQNIDQKLGISDLITHYKEIEQTVQEVIVYLSNLQQFSRMTGKQVKQVIIKGVKKIQEKQEDFEEVLETLQSLQSIVEIQRNNSQDNEEEEHEQKQNNEQKKGNLQKFQNVLKKPFKIVARDLNNEGETIQELKKKLKVIQAVLAGDENPENIESETLKQQVTIQYQNIQIGKLQNQIKSLTQNYEDQIGNLKNSLFQQQSHVSQQSLLKEYQEAIQEMQQSKIQLDRIISIKEQSLSKQESDLMHTQEKYEEENQQLKQKVEELENETNFMSLHISTLKNGNPGNERNNQSFELHKSIEIQAEVQQNLQNDNENNKNIEENTHQSKILEKDYNEVSEQRYAVQDQKQFQKEINEKIQEALNKERGDIDQQLKYIQKQIRQYEQEVDIQNFQELSLIPILNENMVEMKEECFKKLEEFRFQINQLKQNVSHLKPIKKEYEMLQSEVQQKQLEQQNLSSKYQKLESQNSNLCQQIQKLQNENNEQQQIQMMNSLNSQQDRLKLQESYHPVIRDDNDNNNANQESNLDLINQLKLQIETLEIQLKFQQEAFQLNEKKTENNKTSNQEQFEKQHAYIQQQIKEENEELEQQTQQINLKNDELNKNIAALDCLEQKILSLQVLNQQNSDEIQRQKQRIKNYQIQTRNDEILINQLNLKVDSYSQREEEFKLSEENINAVQNDLTNLNEKFIETQNDLLLFQLQKIQMNDEMRKQFKTINDQNDKIVVEYQSEIGNLTAKIENLNQKNESLSEKLLKLENEYEEYQQKNENLQQKLLQLENEYEEYQQNNQQQEFQISDINSLQEELNQNREQNQNNLLQIAKCQEQIQNLITENKNLIIIKKSQDTEKEKFENIVKELKGQINNLNIQKQKLQQNVQEQQSFIQNQSQHQKQKSLTQRNTTQQNYNKDRFTRSQYSNRFEIEQFFRHKNNVDFSNYDNNFDDNEKKNKQIYAKLKSHMAQYQQDNVKKDINYDINRDNKNLSSPLKFQLNRPKSAHVNAISPRNEQNANNNNNNDDDNHKQNQFYNFFDIQQQHQNFMQKKDQIINNGTQSQQQIFIQYQPIQSIQNIQVQHNRNNNRIFSGYNAQNKKENAQTIKTEESEPFFNKNMKMDFQNRSQQIQQSQVFEVKFDKYKPYKDEIKLRRMKKFI